MLIKNIHDRSPFSLFIHALFCTMSGNKVMFPISEGNLNFLLCSENLIRDLCPRAGTDDRVQGKSAAILFSER